MAKPTFTLKGEGRYVRIVKPDNVSKKYQLNLVVDSDAAEAVIETIREEAASGHPKEFKANKVALNYETTEDGRVAFKLRNGWKPTLTDAKGRAIKGDPKIGDGSTLKVRFTVEAGGFGDATKKRSVLLIPRTVMLVNLIPYTAGGWGDDEVEEDGYVSDGSEEEIQEDAETEETNEAEEATEETPAPAAKQRRKVAF